MVVIADESTDYYININRITIILLEIVKARIGETVVVSGIMVMDRS